MEEDDDQKLRNHPNRKDDSSEASTETGDTGYAYDFFPAESSEEDPLEEALHSGEKGKESETLIHRTDCSEREILALAKRYGQLSPQTEKECFKVISNQLSSDADKRRARTTIICYTIKQIVYSARTQQRRRRGCEFVDLCQVGAIAVQQAIDGFDISLGVPFSKFADSQIEGAMSEYFRDHGRTIRLPNRLLQDLTRLSRAIEEYQQVHKTKPSDGHLAEMLGCDEKKVNQLLVQLFLNEIRTLSYDPELGESEPIVHSLLHNDITDQPENLFEHNEKVNDILNSLDTLTPYEREAILLHHFDEYSLAKVGAQLGVSGQMARTIVKRGIRKLRECFLRRGIGVKHVSAKALEAYLLYRNDGHRTPVKAHEGLPVDVDQHTKRLFHQVQYAKNLDALFFLVLSSLERSTTGLSIEQISRSIQEAGLSPISDDSFENEPSELAHFAKYQLQHKGLIELIAGDSLIRATAIGLDWLNKRRKTPGH